MTAEVRYSQLFYTSYKYIIEWKFVRMIFSRAVRAITTADLFPLRPAHWSFCCSVCRQPSYETHIHQGLHHICCLEKCQCLHQMHVWHQQGLEGKIAYHSRETTSETMPHIDCCLQSLDDNGEPKAFTYGAT